LVTLIILAIIIWKTHHSAIFTILLLFPLLWDQNFPSPLSVSDRNVDSNFTKTNDTKNHKKAADKGLFSYVYAWSYLIQQGNLAITYVVSFTKVTYSEPASGNAPEHPTGFSTAVSAVLTETRRKWVIEYHILGFQVSEDFACHIRVTIPCSLVRGCTIFTRNMKKINHFAEVGMDRNAEFDVCKSVHYHTIQIN
jgi:hypothetical protein